MIDGFTADLFWRHIADRAEHHTSFVCRGVAGTALTVPSSCRPSSSGGFFSTRIASSWRAPLPRRRWPSCSRICTGPTSRRCCCCSTSPRRSRRHPWFRAATDTEPTCFSRDPRLPHLRGLSPTKAMRPPTNFCWPRLSVCPSLDESHGVVRGSRSSTSSRAWRSSAGATRPPPFFPRPKVLPPLACIVTATSRARCSRQLLASLRPARASGRARKRTISARCNRPMPPIVSASPTRVSGMRTGCWRATTPAIAGGPECLLAEALSLYESIGMPGFARRTSARLAAV